MERARRLGVRRASYGGIWERSEIPEFRCLGDNCFTKLMLMFTNAHILLFIAEFVIAIFRAESDFTSSSSKRSKCSTKVAPEQSGVCQGPCEASKEQAIRCTAGRASTKSTLS